MRALGAACAAVLLCWLAPGQAAAQEKGDEAAAALAAKVKALVTQLDDAKAEQRDAAEKGLVDMGPEILPLLPRVTPRTSAETKDRLLRITRSLDEQAANAVVKPREISLSGEYTLAEALTEIEKQTGNKVFDARQDAGEAKLKLLIDKAPFWQGLDLILDEADVRVDDLNGEPGQIRLVSKEGGESKRVGRAAYQGVFRGEPTFVEASRDLRNEAMKSLRLNLEMAWEPRLRPVVFEIKLEDIVAKDDAGNPIAVDGVEGDLAVDVEFDATSTEMELPFVLPDRGAKKIGSLKVKGNAVLLGREANFEFPAISKARDVKQTQAGVTVTVERVVKSPDGFYDVQVRVEYERAEGAIESYRGWMYQNDAYLLAPNGEKLEFDGSESLREDESAVGMLYQFELEDDIDKYKFVVRAPVSIVKVPFEIELRDVELP